MISELMGKTLIEISPTNIGDDEIVFTTDTGEQWKMYHSQDCCESVSIEDINGDLQNLIGSPITLADESTSDDNPEGVKSENQDSFTWTFYRIATAKEFVVIRWYGESNGYYSESVYFEKLSTQSVI